MTIFYIRSNSSCGEKEHAIGNSRTHTNNRRVIRHGWGRFVLFDAGMLFDPEIFHVASSKDDVFIDLVGRCNLILGTTASSFGSERTNIFE